jgi:hypothetical protein
MEDGRMTRYLLPVFVLLAGCSPHALALPSAKVAARPDGCDLEFVKVHSAGLAAYQEVGTVYLFESDVENPLEERLKSKVQPHACAMGGDTVAVIDDTQGGLIGYGPGSTVLSYTIARHQQGAASAPAH